MFVVPSNQVFCEYCGLWFHDVAMLLYVFYEILPWSMFLIFLTFLIVSLNLCPLEVDGFKGRFWLIFVWIMYSISSGTIGVHFTICEMRERSAPHIWSIVILSHNLNFELHWVVRYFDILFHCWVFPLFLKMQQKAETLIS